MGQIKVKKNVGGIEGLCIIEPTLHGDSRGYFMETYNKNDMAEAGLTMEFVQDNQSASTKGVLRGLHFQKQHPQGKLVRVINGTVFDVVVDLRSHSGTYGKWFGEILSAENNKQFYIPEGFAHGFLVLSDTAEFCYKCTDFYHPGDEGGLAWNDPEIGIEWPELVGEYSGCATAKGYHLKDGTSLTLSEKDQKWLGIAETFKFKSALYEMLPGSDGKTFDVGKKGRTPVEGVDVARLVRKGDPARAITPCAACHGMTGKGRSNGKVPVLHGQNPTYLAAQLRDYRDGRRDNDVLKEMRFFAQKLTDDEINALADFYAGETGWPGVKPARPAAKAAAK